jgi:uncharacterized protein YndB with AHSA1/START domain
MKFRIQINAKPEDVFAYVSDLSKHSEWANPSAKLQVEKVSDGPIGSGTKFRSTQRFAGKSTSAQLTIRDFDPPRRFVYAADQGEGAKVATFVSTLTFTPANGGTLVERDLTRENAPPLAALGIIFYPAIRADAMKSLRNLKKKLES